MRELKSQLAHNKVTSDNNWSSKHKRKFRIKLDCTLPCANPGEGLNSDKFANSHKTGLLSYGLIRVFQLDTWQCREAGVKREKRKTICRSPFFFSFSPLLWFRRNHLAGFVLAWRRWVAARHPLPYESLPGVTRRKLNYPRKSRDFREKTVTNGWIM